MVALCAKSRGCTVLRHFFSSLTVVVFPIGYTAYISLTNMNLYHWADFRVIGLSNYVRALFKFDSGFLGALFTTLLWTVVNMALQLFCGFWIALGLNAKGLRLRRLYKTLLMLPWAMPAYVSILLWRVGIFNTEFGLLNQWLTAPGAAEVQHPGQHGHCLSGLPCAQSLDGAALHDRHH